MVKVLPSKKSKKVFIIAVNFWVLSTKGKETKNTVGHVLMKKVVIFAWACINLFSYLDMA